MTRQLRAIRAVRLLLRASAAGRQRRRAAFVNGRVAALLVAAACCGQCCCSCWLRTPCASMEGMRASFHSKSLCSASVCVGDGIATSTSSRVTARRLARLAACVTAPVFAACAPWSLAFPRCCVPLPPAYAPIVSDLLGCGHGDDGGRDAAKGEWHGRTDRQPLGAQSDPPQRKTNGGSTRNEHGVTREKSSVTR